MNRIKNEEKNKNKKNLKNKSKKNKNNKKNKNKTIDNTNKSNNATNSNKKSCIGNEIDIDIYEENKIDKNKSKKKNKNKNKKKHPIRNFFIFLFIVIIILGILFYKKVQNNGGGIQGVLCTILGQTVDNLNNLETFNILLLGISEDIDTKLTDTIIVCSYNPKDQSAYMLSIPRDTFVGKNKNTAKGSDKINSIYSKKGINKLLETINNMVNMNIKYYAIINNNALIDLVNSTRWNLF